VRWLSIPSARLGNVLVTSAAGQKRGGVPATCQIEAELEVFHDVTRGERGLADRRPRKRHAGSHQLARQTEAPEAECTDLILDDPREGGDAQPSAGAGGACIR
jgi:hypothetical protein